MGMFEIVALTLFVWSPLLVSADIPSHCLHGDVLGTWEIHSGVWRPCGSDMSVTDPMCGYQIPDTPAKHREQTSVFIKC